MCPPSGGLYLKRKARRNIKRVAPLAFVYCLIFQMRILFATVNAIKKENKGAGGTLVFSVSFILAALFNRIFSQRVLRYGKHSDC